MSEPAEQASDPAQQRRVAFESLRERTDELELIISGISLLGLLSLPGWLFEHWARLELHAEGQRHLLISLAFQLASGLSMTLAGAFMLHLAIRAYWVGLIGLKATFPGGIRWDAIRSIGPITRDFHRRTVAGLDGAIDDADRWASIVFALVSLVAVSVIWIGVLLACLSLIAMGLAALTGLGSEPVSQIGTYVFSLLTLIVVLPALLLDSAWLARRWPGSPAPWRRTLVEALVRLQGVLFPQRLVLPVQFALESNLPRGSFTVIFLFLIMCSAMLGSVQERSVREFAVVASYAYFNDADAGLRSAHYESLRSDHDTLARVPLIPSDLVADGHLRLFLPYLPDRDNALLRRHCAQAAPPDRAQHQACLAGLWQVAVDAAPIDVADFVLAERRDIGQRGLQGYLSLAGLVPGRHELRVVWRGGATAQGEAKPVEYRIPFWFSPPYQQDLAPAAR